MTTIRYATWGRGTSELDLGTSCRRLGGESDLDAVVRSVCRRTGLSICAGPRNEGTALVRNQPVARHYAFTIGRPVSRRLGGGYTPVAEVWVAIKCRG